MHSPFAYTEYAESEYIIYATAFRAAKPIYLYMQIEVINTIIIFNIILLALKA